MLTETCAWYFCKPLQVSLFGNVLFGRLASTL